jgi:endonuclease/exonuclease/phosphatase family metal-dependent hydrolase
MVFLKKYAPETDIFCLQEVLDADQGVLDERHPDEYVCGDLYRKIVAALPEFNGAFASFGDYPHRQSQAIFIRKTVPVTDIGDFLVYEPVKAHEFGSAVIASRKLQHVTFDLAGRECVVANLHGLWNGGGKGDCPERIAQSEMVRKFLDGAKGAKVLCGDFNLLPDTESLAILERGMVNLVKTYSVKSTRTPLYREYGKPGASNFADYVIVSPDIKVESFDVLPDLASDHAALRLEFH